MQFLPKSTPALPLKTQLATGLGLLLLLLWSMHLLWPGTFGPFVFDDFPYFERLEKVGGDLNWRSFGAYVASYTGGPFGRALSMSSFLLNDVDWPSTPDTFKRTNVFIHLLNGVFLFGLVRSLGRLRLTERQAVLAALIASAAWLLHPIQTSAVFLTVQRITLLSAMWVLLALWAYVALVTRARSFRETAVALIALTGLTGLGVLSKENALLAFLFAAILNKTVLSSALEQLDARSRNLLTWALLLPIAAAIAVVVVEWPKVAAYTLRDFTPTERLMTEWRVLLDYLQQILMPRLAGSGIYHDDYVISRGLLSPPSTLGALVVILGLVFSALALRRRSPLFALGVLWFFAGHLIESTVIDLELYFEHRNYAPSIGFAITLGLGAVAVTGELRRFVPIVLSFWLALFSFNTWHQSLVWGDAGRLASVWFAEHPRSPRAHQQLADFHVRSGRLLEGRGVLESGLQKGISPSNFALSILLIDCWNQQAFDQNIYGDALVALRNELPNPGTAHALRDLRGAIDAGRCHSSLGLDEWILLSDAAMANPRRHSSEAFIRLERAAAFVTKRDLGQTMKELEQAFEVAPEAEIAYFAADVLLSAGLYDDASEWLEKARSTPLSSWRAYATQRDAIIDARLTEVARREREATQAPPVQRSDRSEEQSPSGVEQTAAQRP